MSFSLRNSQSRDKEHQVSSVMRSKTGAAPIATHRKRTKPAAAPQMATQPESKQRDTEVMEMDVITRLWVKVLERERAQTMTEYVLIIAAVALVALVAYKALGTAITNEISNVTTNLTG
jgi:Flp pilus assembly pilin Flp